MSSKHIVYLAETEYHLMICINLALTKYSELDYENSIYYWVSENRLNYQINEIPDFNGKLIPLHSSNRIAMIKSLSVLQVNNFIFFQESNPLLRYLASILKRKGAFISLAPDGYKPYGFIKKKHEVISMVIDTWKSYRFLFSNKLYLANFELFWNYRYGSSCTIDEVLLHDPGLFNRNVNQTKALIARLPVWNKRTLELLPIIFGFERNILPTTSRVLFYVNQPLWSETLRDVEISILKKIGALFPDRQLMIKLHPHTSEKVIQQYKQLKHVYLIHNSLPAELFMIRLKNSIFISGWSAALLFEVTSNNYYYLYELFNKVEDKIMKQLNFVSFPHVHTVTSVDEIIFPI